MLNPNFSGKTISAYESLICALFPEVQCLKTREVRLFSLGFWAGKQRGERQRESRDQSSKTPIQLAFLDGVKYFAIKLPLVFGYIILFGSFFTPIVL